MIRKRPQAEIQGFIPITRLRKELNSEIQQFNEKFPEKNGKRVFIMMRMRSEKNKLFFKLEEVIKSVLSQNGFQPFLASDYTFNSESIWRNICVYIFTCDFGIAVLEKMLPEEDYLNPNVLLELGFMMGGLGKTSLVLKERRLKKLPTDILSYLYEEFEGDSEEKIEKSVTNAVKNWIDNTLKIQGLLVEKDISRVYESIKENNISEKAERISTSLNMNVDMVEEIFDFHSDRDLPSLLINIDQETRVERQRTAVILLSLVNYILNQKDKITSSELKILLEESDVEPEELNKAFKGQWAQLIKIEGKNYRITTKGRKRAKVFLNQHVESIKVLD